MQKSQVHLCSGGSQTFIADLKLAREIAFLIELGSDCQILGALLENECKPYLVVRDIWQGTYFIDYSYRVYK